MACGAIMASGEPEFCVAEDVALLHAAGISVLTPTHSIAHARELHAIGVDFIEADDTAMLAAAVAAIRGDLAVAV